MLQITETKQCTGAVKFGGARERVCIAQKASFEREKEGGSGSFNARGNGSLCGALTV